MRLLQYSLILVFLLSISRGAHAQSNVIYEDDFEGVVDAWTDNRTDFDPDVSRFLGRFALGQTTTAQTFSIPPDATELVIAFDLYRFDSWDDFAEFGFDRFEIDIDGVEIFSLPFPDPQGARSGTLGNIAWSHTPIIAREELAFGTGEFFFDQTHRFEIIVSNPGLSVALTLRANLSQDESDESAGFDNFLVTSDVIRNDILAVAENFPSINGDNGGSTTSVLTSDTLNGIAVTPSDVSLTQLQSSSTNVTLNPASGLITVAANTPAGVFTVDYQICETADITNCSSVTEMVTVFTTGGTGLQCPAGTALKAGTFHVVSATSSSGQPNNLAGAIGPPLAEGTTVSDEADSGTTFFQSLFYDLTGDPDIFIPEGVSISVSLANHFGSDPIANISSSLDGNNPAPLGTSQGPWVNNTFRFDEYIVPSGGARFLNIGYGGGGGLRFDGVTYDNQCQPFVAPTELTGRKTVAIFDPSGLGLYALPGNDVIYTIAIENPGTDELDSDSLVLIDRMPSEVTFFNDDIDDTGPETEPVTFDAANSGLTFNFATDVSFAEGAAEPARFEDCTYTPLAGYDPNVTFLCIKPRGSMSGSSNWSISFRARID